MTFDNVKSLVLLAAVAGVGYAGWRAYQGAAGAAGRVGDVFAGAYDAVSGVLSSAAGAVGDAGAAVAGAARNSPSLTIPYANFTRPAVPVGGASVQRAHVTDLPEGSYQAAAMFWSLHPDAVFYD